jgi:hypothetical protein
MARAAALAGVEAHGLKWKFKLPIKAFIPKVSNIQEDEAHKCALIIQRAVERTSAPLRGEIPSLPDIEWNLVETKEELIDALNRLYDWADNYRVLIC